jgi:hypothetical protein
MLPLMRRSITSALLALVALAAFAASASAAATPVITSFSPAQVRVGQTLVINGKNFKKGVKNNRVFFIRATDGKTVRARPTKANSTRRMEVAVPATVTKFLAIANGKAVGTRFQLQVLSGKFSKKTPKSRSPIVLAADAPTTPGTTGTPGIAVTPPAPDCDADGTPDASDTDDDNDGLTDDIENAVHTNPCNKDTDGDGVEDGYEYYSAKDLNDNAIPYPASRPFPNALAADAEKDYDGDGMTQKEEFAAWNLYGGRVLPAAAGQSFPYSDGNQASPAPANAGGADFDQNTVITDEEKDADNDGLANWLEMAHGRAGNWTRINGTACPEVGNTGPNTGKWGSIYSDCGNGRVPNADTFAQIQGYPWDFTLDYLAPDSDGDGVTDAADDQDHDRISNAEEITAGTDGWYTDPQDPCDPFTESASCPQHAG